MNEELARTQRPQVALRGARHLDEFGPASQAELSYRTGIYRSDVVAVINELADRGHVERSPNPADRRQNVIILTKQGYRQLLRLDKLLAGVENEVLAR